MMLLILLSKMNLQQMLARPHLIERRQITNLI